MSPYYEKLDCYVNQSSFLLNGEAIRLLLRDLCNVEFRLNVAKS